MKKILSVVLLICLLFSVFALSGCSNKSKGSTKIVATEKQIPDLTGEWKQTNSKTDGKYQTAAISGNTIEIYWVSDNGDTKSLYWAGSFIAPTTADDPYTWDSKNDHDKTGSAMLASSDDVKTIKYQSGILSYETSALGTTTTVKLEKQK